MARKPSRSDGGQLALPQEPKVNLMNEGGGREGVIGRLPPELSPRDVTKLVVHERHESLERIAIACAPPRKTLGDLAGSHDVNRAGERPNHIVSAGSQPPSLARADQQAAEKAGLLREKGEGKGR